MAKGVVPIQLSSFSFLTTLALSSCLESTAITAVDLATVDPGDQLKVLLMLTPEESRANFEALEKWARVGRPQEATARHALNAIGASEHARSKDVLVSHLRGRNRASALTAMHNNRRQPGFCQALAKEWVMGPDPDPAIEDTLERAMTRTPFACASDLAPYENDFPERVQSITSPVQVDPE